MSRLFFCSLFAKVVWIGHIPLVIFQCGSAVSHFMESDFRAPRVFFYDKAVFMIKF